MLVTVVLAPRFPDVPMARPLPVALGLPSGDYEAGPSPCVRLRGVSYEDYLAACAMRSSVCTT